MSSSLLFRSVSFLALVAALPAHAEGGFYLGLGLESGHTKYDLMDGLSTGSESGASVTGFAGYRYSFGSVFVGGEVGASGSAGADVDSTLRTSLQVGANAGPAQVFLSFGRAHQKGSFADAYAGGTAHGNTFGIGVDYGLTPRLGMRFELLRDLYSETISGKSYKWHDTALRAAATFRF